ncbi:MAG: NAD(P)H-hydrate dehydratase, partial [Bacteroidales bacterium]|nr:NAD(P)H-hydrate dehydratase [Bacteroidales bacterium]
MCTDWVASHFASNVPVSVFTGPGNNGGDGLAIARMLADRGYSVKVYICGNKLSPDSLINYERLLIQKLTFIKFIIAPEDFPRLKSNEIIIDALFGSGLTRPVTGIFRDIIQFLNKSASKIIAIDIPSGFFSEDNSQLESSLDGGYVNAVRADFTLSLELPFLSFLFPDAQYHVGELVILPIGLSKTYLNEIETDFYYVDAEMAKGLVKKRQKFDHKGSYGHALIIAGSYGKMGAAILACKACLRAGVGLLTVHVPVTGYEIMQMAVPEAMTCIDESGTRFCKTEEQGNYTTIGIGPGLGTKKSTVELLDKLLQNSNKPLVIDADALNIIAANKEMLKNLPVNSILTPHPGEFSRLVGEWTNYFHRLQMQIEFAKKYKVFLILKGANTCIATPKGICYFNSSGNPGMATAGSGDVLTGILTSLVSQGYTPENAAVLGVYIHGMAGDIASEVKGQQALIAGDIIDNLGKSYLHLSNL